MLIVTLEARPKKEPAVIKTEEHNANMFSYLASFFFFLNNWQILKYENVT